MTKWKGKIPRCNYCYNLIDNYKIEYDFTNTPHRAIFYCCNREFCVPIMLETTKLKYSNEGELTDPDLQIGNQPMRILKDFYNEKS